MLASLLWLVPSWMISPSFAFHPVTVTGVLKGYFLSPDGTLKVREVPFAFPEKPTVSDLPDRLFPLPAGYYLQGKFSASEPIQSVWLLSGNGRLLWRRHYPEGVLEEDMPYQAGGWIGLRGEDGLSVRLLVRFVDGKETVIRPRFPVRFERVLPLKVDWLDFVRIAEVAHLLKKKGKEIWEGFSLDGIPFLLEGAEGQWVLINHPKPPKGFERYDGPLPKVPFQMTVYVGRREARERRREEVMGWIEEVNRVKTVALRYYPTWWALSACDPFNYLDRQPNALLRLEAILHEAFHVWWFQKMKMPKVEGREKKAQAVVAEIAERECLARALEAKEEKERKQWAKAFLIQREKRRRLEMANESEVISEQQEELDEGIATFVHWRAMQAGHANDYQPIPEMDADPNFYGYQSSNEATPKAVREVSLLERPYILGLAQILLLSEWFEGWQREIMKGRSLEELLSQALREVTVAPELLAEVEASAEKEFREALERTKRAKFTEGKLPQPNVTIWLYLPVEVVRLVKQVEENFGKPLMGITFHLPEIFIRVSPPVWAVPDIAKSRLGILWDVNKQLMVIHRPDETLALIRDGLEVRGNLKVTWDVNGVHVRPDENSKYAKGGASKKKISRKKAWYAVVLPVALLAAIANHDTKALQEQETITMEGTTTGVFLNAATDQFETVTLPVPSVDEDYFYADEEEYTLHVTFTPSWDPTNPATTDIVFMVSATYYNGKLVWNFQIGSGPAITVGGRKYDTSIVTRLCPCVGGTEQRVCLQLIERATGRVAFCYPLKKVPPPGQLLVKVFLITENEQDPHHPTISPFPEVTVEAHYWSEKKKRWEFKAKVTSGDNGEALFPELAPGNYQLRGFKGRPIPACPQVTELPVCISTCTNLSRDE